MYKNEMNIQNDGKYNPNKKGRVLMNTYKYTIKLYIISRMIKGKTIQVKTFGQSIVIP